MADIYANLKIYEYRFGTCESGDIDFLGFIESGLDIDFYRYFNDRSRLLKRGGCTPKGSEPSQIFSFPAPLEPLSVV